MAVPCGEKKRPFSSSSFLISVVVLRTLCMTCYFLPSSVPISLRRFLFFHLARNRHELGKGFMRRDNNRDSLLHYMTNEAKFAALSPATLKPDRDDRLYLQWRRQDISRTRGDGKPSDSEDDASDDERKYPQVRSPDIGSGAVLDFPENRFLCFLQLCFADSVPLMSLLRLCGPSLLILRCPFFSAGTSCPTSASISFCPKVVA